MWNIIMKYPGTFQCTVCRNHYECRGKNKTIWESPGYARAIIVPRFILILSHIWIQSPIRIKFYSNFIKMIHSILLFSEITNRKAKDTITYHETSNISRILAGKKCSSLRCSWSIACRCCSNYICNHDLTSGFDGLGKDNCKTRRETFKFLDLVRLILEVRR